MKQGPRWIGEDARDVYRYLLDDPDRQFVVRTERQKDAVDSLLDERAVHFVGWAGPTIQDPRVFVIARAPK